MSRELYRETHTQRRSFEQNHFQNDAIKSLLNSSQNQSNNHKHLYNNSNA